MNNIQLIHGEALEEMDKLIANGIKVDAIITDPPYNLVEKQGGSIHLFRQSKVDDNDTYTPQSTAYDIGFSQNKWLKRIPKILKNGGNIIIFNDWENMGDIAKELRKLKIKVKTIGHWQKTNPQPAEWKRRFVSGREYFLYAIKQGKYIFNVEKLHKGVFEYSLTKQSEKKKGKHPNQKPIELMQDIVKILTNENDLVLDPFMGSGTTLLACQNLNRKGIGIELDPKYFDIATERLQESYPQPFRPSGQNGVDKTL